MLSIQQVAARYNPATTAAAKRALKECGLKQTLAGEVLAAYAEIDKARAAKRAAKRLAKLRRATGRPSVILPKGTPAARLDTLRRIAIGRAFKNAFRQPAHGSVYVTLTDDPAQVGISVDVRDDWDIYAKSYKHGPARVQDTTITAPRTWRTRVERRGLSILDGLMTLDAAVLEGAPEGVTLYAAMWLAQGRGTSVTVSNGVIAISGEHSYHADSGERALAGIKRKVDSAKWAAEMRTANLSDIVTSCSRAMVRLTDARAVGACEYGIRAWCHRVGISYEAGEASISDVYAGYLASPAPEARGAILHAARRARKPLPIAA